MALRGLMIQPHIHYVVVGDHSPLLASTRSQQGPATDQLGPLHRGTGSLRGLHLYPCTFITEQ